MAFNARGPRHTRVQGNFQINGKDLTSCVPKTARAAGGCWWSRRRPPCRCWKPLSSWLITHRLHRYDVKQRLENNELRVDPVKNVIRPARQGRKRKSPLKRRERFPTCPICDEKNIPDSFGELVERYTCFCCREHGMTWRMHDSVHHPDRATLTRFSFGSYCEKNSPQHVRLFWLIERDETSLSQKLPVFFSWTCSVDSWPFHTSYGFCDETSHWNVAIALRTGLFLAKVLTNKRTFSLRPFAKSATLSIYDATLLFF